MVAIITVVVFIVLGITMVGLLIFGPKPATESRREEREQRHVEDDIIPLIGFGVIGADLVEEDPLVDGGEDFTELAEDWEDDDELTGW